MCEPAPIAGKAGSSPARMMCRLPKGSACSGSRLPRTKSVRRSAASCSPAPKAARVMPGPSRVASPIASISAQAAAASARIVAAKSAMALLRIAGRGFPLAERRHRRQRRHLPLHRRPLALEKIAHRAAQPRMGDPMRGIGRRGQVAALDLVLALGAGLDAEQLVLDGEVDGAVVAEFEM